MSYVVYTSIVGLRGSLLPEQNTKGAEFIAFVDRRWDVPNWKQEMAFYRFKSPQRNALSPKLAPHLFFTADYSIWIESNVVLEVPAESLVASWLSDVDIAVFQHRTRNCIYDEAVAIATSGGADSRLLAQQMAGYRRQGVPENAGLPMTFVVARRHSARVSAFNSMWWAEFTRFAAHDQLSLLFAAREAGVKVRLIAQNKTSRAGVKVIPRAGFVDAIA